MSEPIISAVETVLDNGKFGKRTVKFETGLLARQAAGSVTAYLDDETMLLSATTAGKTPKDHFDFFPLTIDVEERMYAVGQIPGSFFRSEGRPGEDAILTCRLIDRPLRPTFKKGLRNEVQVVITVMALDPDMPYDVLAINAASLSTQLSGLPFSGPVGGVRVALIEGQWVAFPSHSQLESAVFDMVVAGRVTETGDVAIMMVEAEAPEDTIALVQGGAQAPTEEVVAGGLDAAKPFIKQLVEAQAQLAAESAKPVQDFPVFLDYEDDVYAAVEAAAKDDTAAAMTIADKQERELKVDEIKAALVEKLSGQFEGREKEIGAAFRSLNKALVRQRVLRDKIRIDGRGLADIRPLHSEVNVIPRVHGSALFERGETQILGVTTLNMLKLEQQLDTLSPEKHRRYMHKYVFPPFSTGETGRVGSPKRREVGHGALARRAILPVLPSREEFPYAIRQLSEAMGSNGSTSMGSVCASTLSLLQAGVPLKASVAGIAMGLISDEVDGETQYVALTDILGAEDAFGDMDFKVAGTREFVTALQLDTKLDGIPAEVLAVRPQPGPRRAPGDPRRDGRGHRRPGGDVGARAAHHHRPRARRQDRRGDRSQGQGHQPDPGRHGRDAVHRGRRHGLHRCDQRRGGRGRQGRGQRDRQPDDARGRRALPRHRGQDDQLRCLRLAHAGQGRPAPHQQAPRPGRWQARGGRRGRAVGGPEGPGLDRRDRRPRQALAGPRRRRGRGRLRGVGRRPRGRRRRVT